ncbi:hypothetical protein NLU13_4008 [Sarocladium strictum]|uniref:DUF202 domain-containing protein n=1 Tax=Sarocladium strictum TaxID=5046 RepID=A0AA39GJG4_SARSR|nr:hypothetical protein NLU13_4008 [Sarocladium strictum]
MTPWWSKLSSPVFKNTGSVARDHLASERTYLAWTRTGLGFVALGIAVERFSRFELMESARGERMSVGMANDKEKDEQRNEQLSRRTLVGTLVILGTGSIFYGTRRYFVVLRRLGKGEFPPAYHGVAALGTVMGALCGGVLVGTARSWSEEKQQLKSE